MRILVLGSSGQLASHLKEELGAAAFWGRAELDVGSSNAMQAIVEYRPTFIVNAAAYTAVDKAETERSAAWSLNSEAPTALARAATLVGAQLVQVSTDYVFDGNKPTAYSVDDPVRPMSVYGASKLAGELAVRTLCQSSWVLRTSWVFSHYGHNFVRTMLRLAGSSNGLRVVADQIGRPTYARDLAVAIARLATMQDAPKLLPYGVYHATGGPIVSWCEFAREIVRRAHDLGLIATQPTVAAITTAEYPTPARRPPNSALEPSEELHAACGTKFDWQQGLDEVLRKLAAAQSA